MKHQILSFLAAGAAVLLGTAACTNIKEKEFDPNDPAVFTIAATPETQSVIAEGGDLVYTFDAPDYWFVSSPVDWLEFEPKSGKPGPVTLTVKAKQNITGNRTALVTVTSKKERGKFSVDQQAWPYYHEWAIFGNVDGVAADQDFPMEDIDAQLRWKKTGIVYHTGESFTFRMTGNDAVNVGLAGDLVEGETGIYTGALKKGGERISLPIEGVWEVTLDLENWAVTAALTARYPWTLIGTIDGTNWDKDFEMADMGRQLKWRATDVPFHEGDVFRFRREKNDAVNLGIDGAFAPVEGAENTYVASLKQDGANIALPAEGWWMLDLDVENATLTAVLTKEFPRVFPGMFWENDGSAGAISWSSTYRFGLDGRDQNNECLTTFPAEVWERIKTETVYLVVRGDNPQIRVTTGWWDLNWGPDYQPGNELLTDNGDGTWTLKFNLSDSPEFVDALDVRHILFTGDRYTPIGLYPEVAWENDGTVGGISWSSNYRFGMDGRDQYNECLLTFPESVWNKLKTGTFYLDLEATNPQIRVVTGWWGDQWLGDDIYPGNERLKDNGDGTFTLTLNLAGHPIADSMDVQHLLFTGDRYTPQRIRIKW